MRLTRVVGAGLGVLLIAGCGGEGQAAQDRRAAPDTPAASDSAATTEATPTPEATSTPEAPTPSPPAPGRTGAIARVPRAVILEQLRNRAERIAQNLASQPPATVPTDVDPDSNRGLGYRMVQEFGFDAAQWPYLDALWRRESGWDHLAENPSSGAYGIPQSLPGSKMAVVAPDWRTNPETQIAWGLAYIAARYGNPQGAWAHSERFGWY